METATTQIVKILNGHRSFETAYKVENYPYGFRLRCTIFYWVETTKKRGDRFCTCTIDPRNGRLNKPKKSTYAPFMYLYLDEIGHVQYGAIDAYEREKFNEKLDFIINTVEEATDEQVLNLKREYYGHIKASYPYLLVKYDDERKPMFTEWMKAKLRHIQTCEFTEMCNFEPAPVQDMPEAEVKMTVTHYQTC